MRNHEVSDFLAAIGDFMEIAGESFFKVRAYRRATEIIDNLAEDVAVLTAEGRLTDIEGIGKGLAQKIEEFLERGTCRQLEELHKEYPPSLRDLLAVPNFGPKKVALVFRELGVDSLDALQAAAESGALAELPGMGKKSQEKVLQGIQTLKSSQGRVLQSVALAVAESIIEALQELPQVEKMSVAGSLRRWRETIGDIDILAATADAGPIMERFVSLPEVREVIAHGETKSSIRVDRGLQVDLRAVSADSFGAALQYFTGSRDHNIRVRERAQARGLRVNEYGIFRESDGERLAGATEEEMYAALELAWIPPELREDSGELAAAEAGELPGLVALDDIRGDLHMHTDWTDGRETIEGMVDACRQRGYEYCAITDHSKALAMTGGLDEKRLNEQAEIVRQVDAAIDGIKVLAGIEVDILADGALDLQPAALEALDLVIGSVHSRMSMPAGEMTDRIIRALETGLVDVLAHPTGRLLGQREGYAVDLHRVLHAAEETRTILEVNAHPHRLDLNGPMCRAAKEHGVCVVVNTDAHSLTDLDWMRCGVGTARRGWLTCDDVVNAWPWSRLQQRLNERRRRW